MIFITPLSLSCREFFVELRIFLIPKNAPEIVTDLELRGSFIDLFLRPIVASKCVIAAFSPEIRFFRSEHIRTHPI